MTEWPSTIRSCVKTFQKSYIQPYVPTAKQKFSGVWAKSLVKTIDYLRNLWSTFQGRRVNLIYGKRFGHYFRAVPGRDQRRKLSDRIQLSIQKDRSQFDASVPSGIQAGRLDVND
jgi:hypothetical protein